jgi:methionyl-tRNA synthetase
MDDTGMAEESNEQNIEGIIKFSDWEKFDFRIAKIIEVKEHPNANRLYIVDIDLGAAKRTLVAGLKGHYTADELLGKLCIVFSNLEPVVIRGVKSEGMILAAESPDKSKVCILQPEKDIEIGSRIC